jgi:hypothetical protein
MSDLAFNGAKDFAGHKLCRMCWDQERPKPAKSGAHRCEGGKCECPCRLMKEEHHPKVKKDFSLQTTIDVETITV